MALEAKAAALQREVEAPLAHRPLDLQGERYVASWMGPLFALLFYQPSGLKAPV